MEFKREELIKILGKTFKGTLIQDDILNPYFIVRYADGGFGVMKAREDAKGSLKYRAISYPSSFLGCLDTIAKEQLNEEGKAFTIQEYIETWKAISTRILEAYKDWNVNNL